MASVERKKKNTKAVLNQHLIGMADNAAADILSSKLSAISESRQDLAPAMGERSKAVLKRDVMQELRKCRAEHENLRRDLASSLDVIEKRNHMLTRALDTIQQNGLTIPKGSKKLQKSMKKSKHMKKKSKGKSKGRSTRGSMRRRRR